MSSVVRISEEMLERVDEAVETLRNRHGARMFLNRREFIDSAVREFLKKLEEAEP